MPERTGADTQADVTTSAAHAHPGVAEGGDGVVADQPWTALASENELAEAVTKRRIGAGWTPVLCFALARRPILCPSMVYLK